MDGVVTDGAAARGFELDGRRVGPGAPCLIIAEAGVNHNGKPELARQLIDAAAAAGADAVKFQLFRSESLVTATAPKAAYQLRTTDPRESQLDMLRQLELPVEALGELAQHCRSRSIRFLCTPFDEACAEALAGLGVPAFKIASGELTNLPLLRHVARLGKPIILSTGMGTLAEVEEAVAAMHAEGLTQLALLHCVSVYPAKPVDVNLRAMATLARRFDVPVGYSDHTTGLPVALAAAALGACIIEKHLTLDRRLPGPDHTASLEPGELMQLVRGVRAIEQALGHGRKEPAASERSTAAAARRSLVAACDIAAGTALTEALVAIKRPGTGLSPAWLPRVMGRRAAQPICEGTLLTMEMLE